MSHATELHELITISRFAGADLLLAQGGGGNTSVKSSDGARMWIKASGLRLSQVRPEYGYLETDLPALRALVRDPGLAAQPRALAHEEAVRRVQAAAFGDAGLRPSLETTFHAVVGPVTLHTHPVYVNAFTCMEGGEAALAEALGEPPIWVRYEPPGYALGLAVDRVCAGFQRANGGLPGQILLANHGLIASAATSAEAIATTRKLVSVGEKYFGLLPDGACDSAPPPGRLIIWAEGLERALRKRLDRQTVEVRAARRAALQQAAADPDQWLTTGPLVPDDVVYCGRKVWRADPACPPQAWLESEIESLLPSEKMIIAVAGLGVVLAGPGPAMLDAMEENLLAHVLVRQLIARRGQAHALPPNEVDYLLSMESEHYRQAIAAGPS